MALNLKKLQSSGRRRLALKGAVEFKLVAKGRVTDLLSTTSNALTQTHTIFYSNASALEPADIYHEMCRARLNELGFTLIEKASLNATRDCCKDDPKYIRDANSAIVIILETYANSFLFKYFPEESRKRRDGMIARFESSDALTSLHTQMGFWGTAGICYHEEASRRASINFPEHLIEQAMQRASDGNEIKNECDKINPLLSELPDVELEHVRERISDEDSIKITEIIMRLFSAKTGLEC